jgi:polyphosphate kinase 2 (PPK2 family)
VQSVICLAGALGPTHVTRNVTLLAGRDAAGRDGGIERLYKISQPRETRVVALGKASRMESMPKFEEMLVNTASRSLPILTAAAEEVVDFRIAYHRCV